MKRKISVFLCLCFYFIACAPAPANNATNDPTRALTPEEIAQAICWGQTRYQWQEVETTSEEERIGQIQQWHKERKTAGVVFAGELSGKCLEIMVKNPGLDQAP